MWTSLQIDPGASQRWWGSAGQRQCLIATVINQVLRDDAHFAQFARNRSLDQLADPSSTHASATDYLFAVNGDVTAPQEVFGRLSWGGQFIYASTDQHAVHARAQDYHARGGFVIDHGPSAVRMPLRLPFLRRSVHYFIARKVTMIPPGATTNRFTFDVHLVQMRGQDDYAVLKQVPTWNSVYERLRQRNPDTDVQTISTRAHKLVDRVFPVFLTREYAFLKLLQRDLPPPYNTQVPQAVAVEKDEAGMVRKLVMNWLRLGVSEKGPLSHIEFARQSADLVRMLHDVVKVIHLDLRLDNFVITPAGVGLVDFGSAVRVGEDIRQSPMLRSLFDEMMSTSQIQRLLGHMKRSGTLTSRPIADKHGQIDKAIDLFYLALQMVKPHVNPDFVSLVDCDPESEVAKKLSYLCDAILRPKNPDRPQFLSASDVLYAIEKIRDRLDAE